MLRRIVVGTSTVALLATLTPATTVLAAEATDAERAAEAVVSLAVALDQLSLTPELGTPLPLMLQSPADLLGFPALFSTDVAGPVQTQLLDNTTPEDTAALEAALTSGSVLGGGTAVTTAGDVVTVTLDVNHQVTDATVPIAYIREADETDPDADPAIAIVGSDETGSLTDVTASLTGTITLTVDPSVVQADGTTYDPLAAASIAPGSQLVVEVVKANGDVAFSAAYGFTEVAVSGTGSIDLGLGVELHDPDGDGAITRGEWESTLFDDLASVSTAGTGDDDVAVTLGLEAVEVEGLELGGTPPGGTIAYTGDLGANGWPDATTVTVDDALADFATVGVEDALSALAQFGTAIQAAQNRVDQKLPFVDARFSDAGSPADDLMTLVERQGAAAVVCGRLDTVPPMGTFLTGTTWYCQAFTTQDPKAGTVQWAGTGVDATDATTDTTVGTAPTTTVEVTSATLPDVSVTFEVDGEEMEGGGAVTVTADRRFRTVQDLHAALDATVTTAATTYDATTGTLQFALDDTTAATTFDAPLAIDDLLRTETRLAGVEHVDGPDSAGDDPAVVEVAVGEVVLDAGFGLVLGDDADVPDDDGDEGTETPRSARYLFLPGEGPELSVASLTADLPEAEELVAHIGYLPVTMDLAAGDEDLAVTNPTEGADALGVDVPVTAGMGIGGGSLDAAHIADVLQVGEVEGATGTFNLAGSLSLAVDLPDGLTISGYSDGAGTVDVAWTYDDVAGRRIQDLAYTYGGTYEELLKPFDLSPTLIGTHDREAAPSAAALTDPAVDFTTAFGFDPGDDVLPLTLFNLTSGASCANVRVDASDPSTLECVSVAENGDVQTATLFGSQRLDGDDDPDNTWQPGDIWEVRGDPTLLRGVVLDALNNLANQLDLVDDATHTAPLPLVGLPPKAFGPQFAEARDAIAEVASRPELQVTKVTGTAASAAGTTVTVGGEDDLSGLDLGVTVTNTTAGWTCPVTSKTATSFTCAPATGSWAAGDTWSFTASVDPAAAAPPDLAALVIALEGALNAQPSIIDASVDLALEDVASPYDSSTVRHLVVDVTLPGAGTLEAPIRVDFGDDPAADLLRSPIEPDDDPVLTVEWESTARLDIGIPWEPTVPLEQIAVLASTGLEDATATADSIEADLPIDTTGSFGPLGLVIGESADLEGTHTLPTGTHTGDLVASGTSEPVAGVVTATTGAADVPERTITDEAMDFAELGVASGDVVQNTTDGWDCAITEVAVDTLTCDAPEVAESDPTAYQQWAEDDAYTITDGRPDDRVIDLDGDDITDEVAAGDLLVNTSEEAETSCVLEADGITEHTLSCGIDVAPGDTWEVRSRTVLQDSSRTEEGAVGFDELLGVHDGDELPEGVTVTVQRTDGGTCEVTDADDVTADTLTCDEGLDGDGTGWSTGDAYTIALNGADGADVVIDVGRDFHRMGIVGATLTKVTDEGGPSCAITEARQHLLVCADGLANPTADFADGDTYRVAGLGIARFELGDYDLAGPAGALSDPVGDGVIVPFADTVAGGLTGATTEPVCQAGEEGEDDDLPTTWAGDACAVLSVGVLDDPETADVDEYRFLGIVKWESTIEGEATGLTAPLLPDALTGAAEADEPLQWSLLSLAFGQVKALVRQALEDSLIYEEFPLIGADVSAGTHLERAIDELEAAAAASAPEKLTAATDIPTVQAELERWVTDLLGGEDGLQVDLGEGDVTLMETYKVTVTLACKGLNDSDEGPCDVEGEDQHVGGDIARVQIDLAVGDNLEVTDEQPDTRPVVTETEGCTNCGSATYDLGFDLGLDGLPFDATSDFQLESKAAWSINVGVGLSRAEGPYLVVGTDPEKPTVDVYADVSFPDVDGCPALPVFAVGYAADRCARLNIGYFQGMVFDGNGTTTDIDPTALRFAFAADVSEASDGDGLLSLSDLVSGTAPTASLSADAAANLDLYFVTGADFSGLIGAGVEGLPSVEGALHANFTVTNDLHTITGATTGWDGDLTYDGLILNLGSFVQNFLSPIADEINVYVKPLKPVIDFVRAPIPVLSDIAKAVGKPPVTVLNVIDEAGFDTTLVGRVLDAIALASDLVDAAANGYIGLGGDSGDADWSALLPTVGNVTPPSIDGFTGKFTVPPKQKRTGPCGKTDDQGNKQPKDCKGTYNKRGTSQTTTVKQLSSCGPQGGQPCTGKEKTRTVTRTLQKPRLTGMGLTFPILDDATQVFWMILGEAEPVLVRFDAGTLAASAGVSVSFGPFMAGPVPVDVTLGASFDFSARFAMGYDVRGIVNMLKQDPDDFDPSALMDGLFIDDLDVNGNDVPEIVVSVTATVGAAVSIKIFKVGLEGGVTVAVEFNLKDPDLDGRLRLDEIRRVAAANPLCIFEVRGTLTFFVNVFIAVDLFIKTLKYTITLFKLKPPIELFKVECRTPPPALARPEPGQSSPSPSATWDLRLLMGSQTHRDARWYATTETKEKFTIRQLSAKDAVTDGRADIRATPDDPSDDVTIDSGTRISVEAFGLYQEFLVPAGGTIIADGDSGHDTIRFEPGTAENGDEIPFTLDVDVSGGAGNDRISTGGGDDVVDGNAGNDVIVTGDGDDTITGGADNDDINGGRGNDDIDGGAGNDRLSGDAGHDVVKGGSDDDDISGGPGLDPNATTGAGAGGDGDPTLNDGDDVLIGGDGIDTLRGHFGDDVVFGDGTDLTWTAGDASEHSATEACDSAAGAGADTIVGEAGDDVLVGGGGEDDITGGRGSDHLCGNDGDDVLDGDAPTLAADANDPRADTISGGAGDDRLYGREGDDVLDGGADDDLVEGATGHDRLLGGTGADALVGGEGHDVVVGDGGAITTGLTKDSNRGTAAVVTDTDGPTTEDPPTVPIVCADRVSVRGGLVDLNADAAIDAADTGRAGGFAVVSGKVDLDGDGDVTAADAADDTGLLGDLPVVAGKIEVADGYVFVPAMGVLGDGDCILGGQGHDALVGGPGHDVVLGDVGNDHLQGDSGDDVLRGAQQDDEVRGGAGADLIHGDSGVDHLYGDGLDSGTDDGADEVHGGTGDDRIEGNADADELYGDDGADTIIGGSSDQGVPGGTGAGQPDGGDVVLGGPGDDRVAGDNANPVARDGDGFVGFELLDLPDVDDDAPADSLSGDDDLRGGGGADRIYGQGGDDLVRGEAGDDTIDGNDGEDEIHGGAGADHLVGGSSRDLGRTSGAVRRLDHLRDAGDTIRGDADADVITGDNAVVEPGGAVTLADIGIVELDLDDTDTADAYAASSGDDDLAGGDGDDRLFGQGGDDLVKGDAGADHAEGNDGIDTLHGGAAEDVLVGGTTDQASLLAFDDAAATTFGQALDGDDTLHGDGGDDVLLGDDVALAGDVPSVSFDSTVGPADGVDGDDTLHGGTGDDRLWGQRGDDVLHGDAGHDLVIGDLATVEPADGAAAWPGGAPRWDVVLVTPDVGGEDELYGGTQDDWLYAGAADDLLEGGLGDDHLEGNGDADVLYGHSADFETTVSESQLLALATAAESDQDDLVGGSSSVHPDAEDAGARDEGDHLVGAADQDVLIGDNGEITRVPDGDDWEVDEITGGHRRDVALFDRERTEDATLPLSEVSGDDTLFGSGGNDRLHGQGGDDHLRGQTGQDQLQGNQGSDWLEGNEDDDDLIGGSDTDADGVGEYDAGDWLHGGEGDDVITGDNARIVREAIDAPYLTTHDRFAGFATDRWVLLHDLDAPADTSRSGDDVVAGGSGADLVFGQDGADRIFGASGDDYAEGSGGADLLVGDQIPDDVLATGTAMAGSAVVSGFGDAIEVHDALLALDARLASTFGIDPSTDEVRDGDLSEGDGQDDLVGGSSIAGHRDGDDTVLGDGAQDFVLGDNAAVVRHLEGGAYLRYGDSGDPDRIVRVTERHDVGAGAATSGDDLLLGGDTDDALWGQDGDDTLWGEAGDDDLFGELGDDQLFGGTGEDALVGDRGGVVNTALTEDVTGEGGAFASTTFATSSPPFLTYTSFLHAVDRRVDLKVERAGSVGGHLEADHDLALDGVAEGGNDLLRGGPDRDALHGGAGDDIMNGDSGGDVLFGYDGADVMWGGRGVTDPAAPDARGEDDAFVDHLFGGRGGNGDEGLVFEGADVLDYRPRTLDDTDGAIADPDAWHEAVAPYDDLEGEGVEILPQHNHGVDWMYGGWDRDVMQANLAEAGPNDGDRLIDWNGAYNLYTHCSQDYGGFNDQRASNPTMVDFLTQLAWANGVGISLDDVGSTSSSAYNALAMVHRPDMKSNSGKAYPNTPGHGTTTACAPEADTTPTGAGQ